MPSNTSSKSSKPTTAKAKSYGQGWGKSQKVDLECPSGALCQVKRPGVNGLIKAGILDSLDTLTGLVSQEVIPGAEGKPEIDAAALLGDKDKFNDMMAMLDKIVLYVVEQPKLYPVPMRKVTDPENGTFEEEEVPEDERPQDLHYIDQIDLEDKTFIMNYVVGGQADIAAFRAQSKAAVQGI